MPSLLGVPRVSLQYSKNKRQHLRGSTCLYCSGLLLQQPSQLSAPQSSNTVHLCHLYLARNDVHLCLVTSHLQSKYHHSTSSEGRLYVVPLDSTAHYCLLWELLDSIYTATPVHHSNKVLQPHQWGRVERVRPCLGWCNCMLKIVQTKPDGEGWREPNH